MTNADKIRNMSVLIKDMEFPKTCAACEWSRYAFPNAWCGRTHKTTDIEIAKNGRPDDCPLVPVPPHGRLIDADALKEAFCGNCFADEKPMECSEPCMDMRIILETPTIIPAEEK